MFALSASSSAAVASVRAGAVGRQPARRVHPAVASSAASSSATRTGAPASSSIGLSSRGVTSVAMAPLKRTSAAVTAGRGTLGVFAGRFETERTYIMIKPDGVQRGYVSGGACLPAACLPIFPTRPCATSARPPPNPRPGGGRRERRCRRTREGGGRGGFEPTLVGSRRPRHRDVGAGALLRLPTRPSPGPAPCEGGSRLTPASTPSSITSSDARDESRWARSSAASRRRAW